jgi:NTE family protein
MSYREHSAQFGVLVSGSPDRDLPAVARTLLGGPFLLSGYRYGELTADQVFLLRGAYYRRISKLPDSLGRGVYMGATYEWASLRAYASADADAGVYRSLSLFVGADTVLGPLYLGAGVSPEVNEVRFFLQFGQPY